MPESHLHKRVSAYPTIGDGLGQPFGEALEVVDALRPNTAIKRGKAKGLRPDRRVLTRDGILVAVEYRYGSPVPQDKLNRLITERVPVLEIDIRNIGAEPSDAEIREFLAKEGDAPHAVDKRFLYGPTINDIVRRAGGSVSDNGHADNFGRLRCLVEGCRGTVANAQGGAYVDPQLLLSGREWGYERLASANRLLAATLPRFACVKHLGVPSVYTTPGGRDWYKTPAAPDTTRISYGQSKRSIGGLDVSFNVETLLQGPSS